MNLNSEIYQRIVSAKMFIDENFQDGIDLQMISKQAFLSRFHFHRMFSGIYRKTPHQYLTQKRMEKAGELLAREGLNIREVCHQVGFESLGSFSSLFKKPTALRLNTIGISPT